MDSNVKISIDARKNAILNAYELSEKSKKEVEDLFTKIEELGTECKDAGEFESKFAASPLNKEYMDLFTKLATAGAEVGTVGGVAKQAVKNAAEGAVRSTIGSAVPTTRAAVHQKVFDAARDIPGVGEALGVKQHVDFFKRFKKKD